jgi:hypothetical protein
MADKPSNDVDFSLVVIQPSVPDRPVPTAHRYVVATGETP